MAAKLKPSLGTFLQSVRECSFPQPPRPLRPPVYITNFWGKPKFISPGDAPDGGYWVPRKFAAKLMYLKHLDDIGCRWPRRLNKRQRQLNQMRRARKRL